MRRRHQSVWQLDMMPGYSPPSTSLNPRAVANPCHWCGAELSINWLEVTGLGDSMPRMVPGMIRCPTPGCVPRCPACSGPVGDIHGPACGDVMAAKLGDLRPCDITEADCGPRWRP